MNKISPEESKLFRDSVGSVTELSHEQACLEPRRPAPIPTQRNLDIRQVMQNLQNDPFSIDEIETGDELSFLRPGIQKQVLRKLRRGQFVIEGELDLHGMIVAEAKKQATEFLNYSISRGIRCVRIIHGKGRGSKNKLPILKNKLPVWLQQRHDVLAYCSARPVDGGTGAVYVLLKRKK